MLELDLVRRLRVVLRHIEGDTLSENGLIIDIGAMGLVAIGVFMVWLNVWSMVWLTTCPNYYGSSIRSMTAYGLNDMFTGMAYNSIYGFADMFNGMAFTVMAYNWIWF